MITAEGVSSVRDDFKREEIALEVYDLIKDIKDPERPDTLEDLSVVYEDGVKVENLTGLCDERYKISVIFTPTVAHCHLATLIGLCIRVRLQEELPHSYKLSIYLKEGSHDTATEVSKQINDKERVSAALENPSLRELVTECLAPRL
ncbi:PREDICTED: MIP18 family protein FAM96A-like [Priapulus caudatus]|uniref:MIP18 family protein FAM96A-like n=1 Tax=Priapulus caudatus TaxID=37621 RepID=A0ABM1DU50_PRICU|nr:PREDICTED: MIP18 family protein FAM96A-like [Priapulus caudatus]